MNYRLTLRFTQTRVQGVDLAVVIRRSWPDADIRAVLDSAGAVAGYDVDIGFDEPMELFKAAIRVCDELGEMIE